MTKPITLLVLVGFLQSSLVQSDSLYLTYYTAEIDHSSCSMTYHEGEKTMKVDVANPSDSTVELTFQNLGQEDNLTNILVDITGSSKGFFVNINGMADNSSINNNFTITKTGQQVSSNKQTGLSSIYVSATNYDNKNDTMNACFDAAFNYNATDVSTNNTLRFNVTTTQLGCWSYNYTNTSMSLTQWNATTSNNMTSWAQSLAKDICNGAMNVRFSLFAFILTVFVSFMNK